LLDLVVILVRTVMTEMSVPLMLVILRPGLAPLPLNLVTMALLVLKILVMLKRVAFTIS